MPRALILAHRGDWSRGDENSLAAFAAALRRPGVDGVEFDVRAARDGTPVVIHDATLRRVRGLDRRVRELSVAELRDRGVPALVDVLDALPEPFFLDIELKDDVAARVVPILAAARGDPPRHAVLSSFRADAIASLRAAAPGWPSWLIERRLDPAVVQRAIALGCTGIAAEWPAISAVAIGFVREARLDLATWTVKDPGTLARVAAMGAIAICVDPGALAD